MLEFSANELLCRVLCLLLRCFMLSLSLSRARNPLSLSLSLSLLSLSLAPSSLSLSLSLSNICFQNLQACESTIYIFCQMAGLMAYGSTNLSCMSMPVLVCWPLLFSLSVMSPCVPLDAVVALREFTLKPQEMRITDLLSTPSPFYHHTHALNYQIIGTSPSKYNQLVQ